MKQEGENHPQEEEPPLDADERMEDEALEQGEGEEEELNEDEAAEFSLLNRQLDQLDQALDAIEEKNDDIHSKLRELLGRVMALIIPVMKDCYNIFRGEQTGEERYGE